MERPELLERLDKAIDGAAHIAVQRGSIKPEPKKSVQVGNVFIEKNNVGLYNILNSDRTKLYTDITVFDVAIIIAQRHTAGENSTIKQILYLEDRFTKYHLDMINYLNCMKSAKKRHDIERMFILEDKFQSAESRARIMRDKISNFKRVK